MSLSVKLTAGDITYEQPTGLFIDGKFVKGKEGKTFETVNPSTEKVITSVEEAGPEGPLSASPYYELFSLLLVR